MALANWTDLNAAIISFMMDRSDLATPAPDFIALAESVIWYGLVPAISPVRTREMETVGTVTLTNGVGTVPTDYLQYRRSASTVNPRRSLSYVTPDVYDARYPSGVAGPGNDFTIIGSSIYTGPHVSTSFELTYYARAAALTVSAPTNWLMTKWPDVYLRGALMQAAEWLKNDGELTKQTQLLAAAINSKNLQNTLANYANAGMAFRTRVA